MLTQTVHFGTNTTEFPLAGAVSQNGNIYSFFIIPSTTVTVEAVNTVVKNANSYTVTTDSVVGNTVSELKLSTNVSIDKDNGNIIFSMCKKDAQTLTNESLQEQLTALGQQVISLTLT